MKNIIETRVEELRKMELLPEERAVMKILYRKWKDGTGKITQKEISENENWMGCHPKYEKSDNEETTLRKVRQIIRDLRVNLNAPILSDRSGYWIPNSRTEVEEYLGRLELEAKAQTKSWFETYKSMQQTFGITSSFFESHHFIKSGDPIELSNQKPL